MNDSNWTTIDARSGDYTGVSLTPSQARTLDRIRSMIPRFDFYGRPDKYEIKKLEISQAIPDPELTELFARAGIRTRKPDVFVHIVTGMKDDTGTMAEVYCRKYRHLKIGPRGGVESSPVTRSGFRSVSLFDAMNSEYWH